MSIRFIEISMESNHPWIKLSITPIEGSPDNYKVQISDSGFEFAANKEVKWNLMCDDTISDDEIADPRGSGVVNTDGTFFFTSNATGESLNED